MSTMLKTAAMSLLSKTLQTFLSKYLSDVDVEGFDMPSVYAGSGWGVRLSNVKLREGVQLMKETPGKLRKKRKKRRKVSKKASDIKSRSTSNIDAEPNIEGEHNVLVTEPTAGEEGNQEYNGDLEPSLDVNGMREVGPARSRLNSFDELEVSLGGSPPATPDGSRPSTPLQDSKSIFSCFAKNRNMVGQAPPIDVTDASIDMQLPTSEENGLDRAKLESAVEQMDQKSALAGSGHSPLDPSRHGADATTNTTEAIDDDDEGQEESDEELEDYDQPYKLCLGDNGTIGTLDIRLVDKELHVLVEDALLTIEAFPVAEETEDASGDDQNGNQETPFPPDDSTSTTSATTATTGTSSTGKTSSKKGKAEAKRDTVGERVLADNPLARAISAIPHLLLRDVRIRVFLRSETKDSASDMADASEENGVATSEQHAIPMSEQAGPDDTMLEIGIEFLSISGGDDILSHFQEQLQTEENNVAQGDTDGGTNSSGVDSITREATADVTAHPAEYLVRHIRTGRGPSAGICVQIFSPYGRIPKGFRSVDTSSWARQRWIRATNFHVLRCSGIDIRARVYLNSKKEVAASSWFYDYEYESAEYDYEDATLDSMLLGVDTYVPGPQFALPPANTDMSRGNTPVKPPPQKDRSEGDRSTKSETADIFNIDENGIHSCDIPSTFHRIGRGLLPGAVQQGSKVSSNTEDLCWEVPEGVAATSALDESMPLPGLTLQMTFREPFEVNLDRGSVDTLGLLKTLFTKKKSKTDDDASDESGNDESTSKNKSDAPASKGMFSGFLPSRKPVEKEEPSTENAFPVEMQPEKIQVLGLHFFNFIIRLHVMDEVPGDMGLEFCYWELAAGCLTIDQQSFKSEVKQSQDIKLEIGYFHWDEHKGTQTKKMMSLGIPVSDQDDEGTASRALITAESTLSNGLETSSLWPCAASALLDMSPPSETLAYRSRERHGIQIRYISVKSLQQGAGNSKSMVNMRLGVTSVEMPWGAWRDVNQTRKNIVWGILGKPKELPKKEPGVSKSRQESIKSVLNYNVQFDGFALHMHPRVKLSLPLTRFSGRQASDMGLFMSTVFNKLQLEYGQDNSTGSQKMLSLTQMSELPENVRMRILFCLKDLRPLETAFEVKRESNAFKRTRAVNKGILKMAKKLSKRTKAKKPSIPQPSLGSIAVSSRQEIMSKLMELGDDELEELWSVHQKYQRKMAKKKANETLKT